MPSTHRAGQPQSSQSPSPFAEELRQVLRSELFRDTCTAATIAQLFSMHRRTLHRHLQAEGHTFRQVADAVRFELACELLENTDMALSQLAAALQYSELSAFTRAFRRWSGQAPSSWRAGHPYVRNVPRSRDPRRLCPDVGSAGQEPLGVVGRGPKSDAKA
jgi:AraC-like DNA-binding protein